MKNKLLIIFFLILFTACKTDKKSKKETAKTPEAEITEEKEEWISLFDGTSTAGWRAYNGENLPSKWVIEDGILTFDTQKKLESEKQGGGDIIYAAEMFDNFELYLEWKIPEGGNSGIFYHVKEGDWRLSEISPEYQLLDDLKWEEINNAKLEDWQKTGADYAMHVPDESQKIIKPAMEWNTSRIIFTTEKVEHWLNGKKLLAFVPWSEDWGKNEKKQANGKIHQNMVLLKRGYIGLQDHDSPLWFRNIKIKKL